MRSTKVLLAGALAGLNACYEDPMAVTLHQARAYKGKTDQHEGDPIWGADQLRLRFQQVQTDPSPSDSPSNVAARPCRLGRSAQNESA
jgi:hypothetical protein